MRMRFHHAGRSFRYVVAGLIGLAIAGGCRSLDELAPPVAPGWPAPSNGERAALERGRRIYVSTCASCHRVVAVGDFSPREWRDRLPEMIDKSGLDAGRAADLRAYVLAARGALMAPERRAGEGG